MIQLRDYQTGIITDTREAYRSGRKSPLIVSPTGSGKTVMFAFIAHGTSIKGKSVLILVHRAELVTQTCRTLNGFGVGHGVIQAGRTPDLTHHVQVASVQTLARRLGIFKPDLIIIDEAHHGTAGSWRKVIDANPQARILGVTATPERLDGRGLSETFDALIRGPEVRDLVNEGFLSRPRYYAPPMVASFDNVHKRGGDFAQNEIAAAMDKPAIIGDAVEHYARICAGQPAVAFCASIAHAEHVAAQFAAAGFRSGTIDGNMDPEARRDVVAALGDGRIHVLTSCDIISEGFDLPVVAAAILLRPTLSLGLHLQQIGRVLRPVYAGGKQPDTVEARLAAIAAGPKPRAIILDHVGNLARHQYAETVRAWSLEGRPKKTGKRKPEEDALDVRQCPECFCCHAPCMACPECGHVYEVKGRNLDHRDGTLEEIQSNRECDCGVIHSPFDLRCPSCNRWTDPKREAKAEVGRARNFDQLVALARSRGYSNPAKWASHILASRQGSKPDYSNSVAMQHHQ
jgi:DNA repair protein RadD